MQILQHPISRTELESIAGNTFGDMVKAVADVERGVMAIDADLHADLERMLLEDGSTPENLWGFNLWVAEEGEDFIEFDSLINIRAWQGNPTRDVVDPEVRDTIKSIVNTFITASVQHSSLENGRWAELSFPQQMANIGSETSRVLKALEAGKESRAESAFARFQELI
ncbi:MAG: hypothetical protein II434_09885, partial [Bacteroidales bacterium]|nr:hypothetical protein [Bacteroidales bacterium]